MGVAYQVTLIFNDRCRRLKLTLSLSRETIRLMMQSQRMIKKEFGVRIELDDDQVMARVFAFASQSSSGELKQCASELMQQLLPTDKSIDKTTRKPSTSSAARIYRGQVIPEKIDHDETERRDSRAGSSSEKSIIYRGRRVR